MECAPQILAIVSSELETSLECDYNTRRQAERSLAASIAEPDFAHALLAIGVSNKYSDKIRLAACRHFKNLIYRRWPTANGSDDHLPAFDSSVIKERLLNILLMTPVHVQAELFEAMAVAAAFDFPKKWSSILPGIVTHLDTTAPSNQSVDHWNLPKIKILLIAALSLFSRFRDTVCTSADEDDLRYCVHEFATHLQRVSRHLTTNTDPLKVQCQLQCLSLCCRIFYSLGSIQQPHDSCGDIDTVMSIQMPIIFEPHISNWIPWFFSFVKDLSLNNAGEDGVALRASAFDNLRLYIENQWSWDHLCIYLDEFLNILRADLRAAKVGTTPSLITLAALRSLTTISQTTDIWHNWVRGPDDITEICEGTVSVLQTYTDIRLFQDEWMDYVKCYSRENCKGTVRWYACRLLHGLMVINEREVAPLLSHNVQKMLTTDASWMEKDAAIYLFVALLRGGLSIVGIDVDTVASMIMPELRSCAEPMLKASVIKFFTEFHDCISKDTMSVLLPTLPRFLSHQSGVVRYYAVMLIENLCTMDGFDVVDTIQNLCTGLSFDNHGNPYLLKCLLRVLEITNIENAKEITTLLMNAVKGVCYQPKTPEYNHYLFEAVALLIRRVGNVHELEESLFPMLYEILDRGMHEFWPYTFQIAAQICRTSQLPNLTRYEQIYALLGNDSTWSITHCVPAFTCFLQELIQKFPVKLQDMISIFNKLARQRSTQDCAFSIVTTLVENYSRQAMDTWMPSTFGVLFEQVNSWMQTRKTPKQMKFMNSLVVFVSVVIVKYSFAFLVHYLQTALGWEDLNVKKFVFDIWLQRIRRITTMEGSFEDKVTTIGLTKLLCEYNEILESPLNAGYVLDLNLQLLVKLHQAGGQSGPNMMDRTCLENPMMDRTCLENAGTFVHSLLQDKDPREYPREFLATSLGNLCAQNPDFLPLVINDHLGQHSKDVLHELLSVYQINII